MTNRPLTDLVAVKKPSEHVMTTHVCSPMHELYDCSHICIGVNTNGPKCSCPQSLVLAEDGKNCRVAPTCGTDHFTCHSSKSGEVGECIPASWKCDSQNDCSDGSDEIDCPPCNRNKFFECLDGHCIGII